jgi:hypothetical protein
MAIDAPANINSKKMVAGAISGAASVIDAI